MIGWEQIKVRDLQRFVAVMEAGTFTGAGLAMDESAKQLSRRIAVLEEQVGARLFHRTTRSVTPTVEAEHWYVEIRAVLDRLQRSTEAVHPTSEPAGLVRLQVPTLMVDLVQEWCGEQLAEHPGLSFDLLVGDHAADLLARGIDLCLTGVAPTGATLLVRKVGSVRPQLMAHHDYLERRGRPEGPSDLAHHDCLRFAGPSAEHHWALTRDDGTAGTFAIGGRLACNDSRTLYRALLQGLGIGPATPPFPNDSPECRRLERVLPGWSFEEFPLYLVLAPGRRRRRSVRYVADALVRLAQDAIDDPSPLSSVVSVSPSKA